MIMYFPGVMNLVTIMPEPRPRMNPAQKIEFKNVASVASIPTSVQTAHYMYANFRQRQNQQAYGEEISLISILSANDAKVINGNKHEKWPQRSQGVFFSRFNLEFG